MHYKNGIVQDFSQYPDRFVPWQGKSTFDVLLETNKFRNGDLSDFIALVDCFPDLKGQLQLKKGDDAATTLFVPVNDALVAFDPSLTAEAQCRNFTNSTVEQHWRNHFVSGNFATSCWWSIPIGTKMSDTELRLESQAGKVLDLMINKFVTINGDVKIIQKDIFSEQGIIHVIDKPLLLDNR
jgi:uncharacterized surface protein with fasciclin (FAS1) repeats